MTTAHDTTTIVDDATPVERSDFEAFRRAQKRRFRLLAGGMLGALLALNVAPAAANHLNVKTSDIQNGAVTTPKLRNGAVKTSKINDGAVKAAKLGKGAVTTAKIRNGAVGPNKLGPQAIPTRGYARVNSNGSVANGTGRNIGSDNISRPFAGIYCFHDLPFTALLPVVTPFEQSPAVVAGWRPGPHLDCPSNTQFTVVTRRGDTGARVDHHFAVAFMGDAGGATAASAAPGLRQHLSVSRSEPEQPS